MKQDDPGESDLLMELAQPARRALVGAGYRRDLAVPPFPHHPMIERSAFDEKNYRPIFYNA